MAKSAATDMAARALTDCAGLFCLRKFPGLPCPLVRCRCLLCLLRVEDGRYERYQIMYIRVSLTFGSSGYPHPA
jgi:hypothetical protein